MSERDLKRLILNPEFSTIVDKGRKPEDRGEGLHIAQTNIEKLKGSIDIRSKEGQGGPQDCRRRRKSDPQQ